MLKKKKSSSFKLLERGRRASLALTLNFVAFAFALSAVTTSYWCEGTRKVAKPFCTGPPVKVKQFFCIRFNSSNINDSRLVQYIFETGEEKFLLKKFHTGIFFSCEQAADMNGFDCRDFSEIAPEHERGHHLFSIPFILIRESIPVFFGRGAGLGLVTDFHSMSTISIAMDTHNPESILCCRHFLSGFRPLWDGGPHDVHHHFPTGCGHGSGRLEAQDLGLQLVLCVRKLKSFCLAFDHLYAKLPFASATFNIIDNI
uniref:Germ cell-specific gene 1-like protein n=1 Tax=Hippocampus comes TaxID=109280 RepID=A0A3Q2YQ63_HIPCM